MLRIYLNFFIAFEILYLIIRNPKIQPCFCLGIQKNLLALLPIAPFSQIVFFWIKAQGNKQYGWWKKIHLVSLSYLDSTQIQPLKSSPVFSESFSCVRNQNPIFSLPTPRGLISIIPFSPYITQQLLASSLQTHLTLPIRVHRFLPSVAVFCDFG